MLARAVAGQDSATQNVATQNGATQDGAGQNGATQDGAGQGSATQGSATQDGAGQGSAGQNHAPGLDALLDSAPGQHAHGGRVSQPHAGDSSPAARQGPGSRYPNELAAASLLATGVLAALGRRRREQLWQRAFGRRLITPEGAEAALAESAIRSGADDPSVQLLDSGLRYLSYALAVAGRTPPTVFAAHLSPENLDLWIAPADLDPPAPWTAVGDGQVWRLPFAALTRVDLDEAGDALALLPGLVSIGTDPAGRVLVNLEAAHGLIALSGPHQLVTAVLSSMAMELATNRWSDQMHLTLVGFGEDLVDLAPDRVTAVRTLDEALPALEARAAVVIEAMASTGVDSAATGRSLGISPEAWAPHYLITAVPPTTAQRSRLLALAKVRHAAAAGYVVAGEIPGASWTWEVTPEGRLVAGVLGLDVEAQLLPGWQQDAVLQLFDAAAQNEGVALAAPPADSAPSQQLDPGNVMPVEMTILGPVSVQAPGTVEPEWRPAHRDGRVPGRTVRRGPPGRSHGRDVAARCAVRDPRRRPGPGPGLARHGRHRPRSAGRGRRPAGSTSAPGCGSTGRCSGPWWAAPRWPRRAAPRKPATSSARLTWYRASCSTAGTRATMPGSWPTAWSTKCTPGSRTPRTGWPRSA